MIKFSASAISLGTGKLIHSSFMRIKNECLKLFQVADTADTDLSLKQWLGLKGLNRVQTRCYWSSVS